MFYLRTLGELALYESEESDQPLVANSKPLIILALLATSPKYSARRDHVAELLWPESGHTRARRSLRQALFYLSKQIGDSLIHSDDSNLTLSLNRERLNVDIWEFDESMKGGDYVRALGLHRGKFMAGSEEKAGREVEHWIDAQNSRVEVGLEVAYSKLVATSLQTGDAEDAVAYAREYAEMDPLNEHAQMILVRALKAAGDEVGALAAYQAYRTLLERELDEEPAADLQEIMERVRDTLLDEPSYVPLESSETEPGRAPADPDLPDIGSERSLARRAIPIAAVGLIAAALLSVVIVAGREVWSPDRASGSIDPFDQVTGQLHVVTGEGNSARLNAMEIRGGNIEIRPLELAATELPSPDGRHIASVTKAPDGWNLAVRSTEDDGEPRSLTRRAGDEFPEAWSPDSRYLLYSSGTLLENGVNYLHQLMVYDLVTGTRRPITELESTGRLDAAWSPDGTRIAFVADQGEDSDVFVVHFDGDSLVNVSEHPGADSQPAWSPDGDRIAFVSDRDGSPNLYVATPDPGDFRQITNTDTETAAPIWLGESVIGFVARAGNARDLWLVDVQTGESRRVSRNGNIRDIHGYDDGVAASWIETVQVTPRIDVASPGQHLELAVEVLNAAGDTVPPEDAGIKWSVTDPSIAHVTEPAIIRLSEVGRTRIVASARGWRADTLNVVSIPLIEREVSPTFAEDWTDPITDRWFTFGEPLPYARAEGGPENGGVFVSNGDAHFNSGAITRSEFPMDEGLSVAAYGHLSFTGKLFQVFSIALYPESKPDTVDWVDARPVLELAVQGPSGDEPAQAWAASRDHRSSVPSPREPTEWHLYTLQVTPEGIVELIIDGVLHWRSTWRLSEDDLSSRVRVALGYQSFETEILHGPVRVYPTTRYYLLDVSADNDDLDRSGTDEGTPPTAYR